MIDIDLEDFKRFRHSVKYTKRSKGIGVEINSRQSGLAYALTNPTLVSPGGFLWTPSHFAQGTWGYRRLFESRPFKFEGDLYYDVEQAYQTCKRRSDGVILTEDIEFNQKLMINLIYEKLNQYPELVDRIRQKGGMDYILDCTHQPTNESNHWNTSGWNGFIKYLSYAYKLYEDTELPF